MYVRGHKRPKQALVFVHSGEISSDVIFLLNHLLFFFFFLTFHPGE